MKILILSTLFVTTISLSIQKRNSVPFAFDVLNPGFRARTISVPNIQSVKLNVSVNHDGRVDGNWQYSLTLDPNWTDGDGDKWYTYENPTVSLNPGDIIYYQSEMITDILLLNGSGKYEVSDV